MAAYQSSVVPIGGAPFIPPSSLIADGVSSLTSSASSSRSSSISSPETSPVHRSYHLGSSSSPSSSPSPPSSSASLQAQLDLTTTTCGTSPRQAALDYSRRLHQHTASMWQWERLNIEKHKLTSPGTSPSQPSKPVSAGYIHAPPPPRARAPNAPHAPTLLPPAKVSSKDNHRERLGDAVGALLPRSWTRKHSAHRRGDSHP